MPEDGEDGAAPGGRELGERGQAFLTVAEAGLGGLVDALAEEADQKPEPGPR
jgi:hypothetical protein